MLKIISGGQTGVDRAALDAWHALGHPTGGYAPKGWRTEHGPDPSLMALGLIETDDPDYKFRTRLNVESADATLIIGKQSPGCNLTFSIAKKLEKPCEWLSYPPTHPTITEIGIVIGLIKANQVKVLNVAGNRESTNKGIYHYTKGFITRLGKELAK